MNHVTLSGTAFEPSTRVAKSGMAVLTFRLSYYQGKGKDGKATYGGIDVTAVYDTVELPTVIIQKSPFHHGNFPIKSGTP